VVGPELEAPFAERCLVNSWVSPWNRFLLRSLTLRLNLVHGNDAPIPDKRNINLLDRCDRRHAAPSRTPRALCHLLPAGPAAYDVFLFGAPVCLDPAAEIVP